MNENEPNRKVNQLLVMAIPILIVEQYKKIAEGSDLELTALEAEAVALKRQREGRAIRELVFWR